MPMYSKDVLTTDGLQHHIMCRRGDVGRYVLLPGDPARTDYIASFLDDAKLVANNREHRTWTGCLRGEAVSVTSTGMGGPSAAIAVEELIHCGADTFIRIGTAGRMGSTRDADIDGVICAASVRDEGTTAQYVPPEFPAFADRRITASLAKSADELGYVFWEGVSRCKDSFYGQVDPDSMPDAENLRRRTSVWERAGAIADEMESAALFIISSVRGCRAGAILSFREIDRAILTATGAVKILIEAEGR